MSDIDPPMVEAPPVCDLCEADPMQREEPEPLRRGYCPDCFGLLSHFAHQMAYKGGAKIRTKKRTVAEAEDLIRRAAAFGGILEFEYAYEETAVRAIVVKTGELEFDRPTKPRSSDGFALDDIDLNMLQMQVAESNVKIDLMDQLARLNNSVDPELEGMKDSRDRLVKLMEEKEEYDREQSAI